MNTTLAIQMYHRDKLEQERYMPDIRYLVDEQEHKRKDWTVDSSEEEDLSNSSYH